MDASPLLIIDRLSSRSTFRGFTGSPCGIIGTLMFCIITGFINSSIVISYSQGLYFQSSYETQASAYSILQSPNDIRMALVFFNKTSGAVANHTYLTTLFDTKIFNSNPLGSNIYLQNSVLCNGSNSKYFSDAVNPIILPDCFIFTPNRSFIYSYVASLTTLQYSTVGFLIGLSCLNPFFCKSGGSTLASVQANLVSSFTNFSAVLYFSTKVLQPDGSSRHQVYNISSLQFTNPSVVSAAFDVQIMMNNVTMDYSIMPWTNIINKMNLVYLGLSKATPKTSSTIISPLPKIDLISTNYQYLTFRYYKKEDWILGIIGGSAFLVFLGLWILCHPFNQALWRIRAAEQLLIKVNPVHKNHPTTLELFKRVTIPYSYFILRFSPFYQNTSMSAFTSLMDITKIIKQGKIAYRNIKHFVGTNMYDKQKILQFQNQIISNRQNKQVDRPRQLPNSSFQNVQIYQEYKQQPPQQNREQRHKNHDESNHKLMEKEGQEHRQLQDIQKNRELENIRMTNDFQYFNVENQQEDKAKQEIKKEQVAKKQNIQTMNGQQNFQFFDQNDKSKNQRQRIKRQQSVKNNKEQNLKRQIIPVESLEQLQKQQDQQKNRITINEKNNDSVIEAQNKETKKEEKQKSSDDNVLSKSNSQEKKNEVIEVRNNQEDISAIIEVNQNQVVLQDTLQTNKHQAQLLGLTPQVLAACKNSENAKQIFENFPTIMHLNNFIEPFNYVYQVQSKKNDDRPLKEMTKFQKFLSYLPQFLEFFDFYKVKIQFTALSANHSWVGVFFTFLILVLPFLQVGNMIQSSGKYQTIVSQDVQKATKINYSLKIGEGFRPAVCFNQNAAYFVTGSSQTVQLQFYTYSASQGYTYYTPVQLGTNQETLLGIAPDSQYYNLDTIGCFIFPDNTPVPMGGYNTPQEAYFGFRISGYCSGTPSYCNSVQSTTNTNLLNFFNSASNTFAFYTPINQYNPNTNKVLSGNVYAQTLREGISNFNMAMAIEQTLYVDKIQLLDSYGERFIGQAPPLIEEGICTSRYQLGELTKAINTSNPYYELKVRPSGYTTKVFLVGNTTDIIMGTLGGIFFLCYIAFHKFGKVYNNFNIRLNLAKQIYNEQAYDQWRTPFKLMYLFARPLLYVICYCNSDTREQIVRMQKVDQKIINDLNAVQLCKTAYTCSKLSTIRFKTLAEKVIAMVYFKERADLQIKEQKPQKPITQQYCDEDSSDSQENAKSNKIANQTNIKISHQTSKPKTQELNNDQLDDSEECDYVKSQSPYKNQTNIQKSNVWQWLAVFDSFHTDAEFSLNGKWRIGSVFGCFMSILSIGIIFALFLYYIIYFDQGFNKRISYDRGVNLDPVNIIPIQLNTTRDFKVAFGFYKKPNFAFQNVSNYLNSSTNSTVSISLYQVVQTWVNSTVVITETKYDLIPCPSNYFNGYFSDNQDPQYFSSVSNGFCLPSNLLLNLTSNFQYNSQFFKISVYNKTVNGSTPLQSLTSSFSLGIYMTIPVINLDSQTYTYQVHQIRPNSEVLSRAYNVNVTLTKKTYTFNNPNSTLGQNNNTITTYNYIESRAYEITNSNSPITAARLYNITFSHSGLMETYNVTYSSITELLGYAGGITLIVIFVLGCIAQSFNTYYKEYLIAKELYVHWPINDQKDKIKNTLERDEDVPLMNNKELERVEHLNELSQFQVWKTWLLSIPAGLSHSYSWNENLSKIELFRRRLRQDLDLFEFYKKIVKIRDTIDMDQQFRLKSNPNIPLTSIYDRNIVIETAIFEYRQSERMYSNVIAHQMSSRDQWRLHIADHEGVKLENVFDDQYLQNVLIYRPEDMVFVQQNRSEAAREEMVQVNQLEQKKRQDNLDGNQVEVQYFRLPPPAVEDQLQPQNNKPSIQNQNQEYNIQDIPDDQSSED